MITGSNWEFLPILYLDVMRLNWTVDLSGNSGIIIIVKGRDSQKNKIVCGISTGDLIKKILETKKNPLTNLLLRGGAVTSSTVPSFLESLFRRDTSNSSS